MTEQEAPRAARIADDVYLRLIARLSMAAIVPILAAIIWLGSNWMEDQKAALLAVVTRVGNVEEAADDLKERVALLEAGQARGSADRERFEGQVVAELRDLRATVVQLSNRVAALDATIQATRDRAQGGAIGIPGSLTSTE